MLTGVKSYLYFEVACLDLLCSQQRIGTKNGILGYYRFQIHLGVQGRGPVLPIYLWDPVFVLWAAALINDRTLHNTADNWPLGFISIPNIGFSQYPRATLLVG